MKITTIGLDLAKHVFQVHAVDEAGKPVIRRRLRRSVRRQSKTIRRRHQESSHPA